MAGGGSIAGMIISLRNNSQMLRRKSMFKKESTYLNTKKEYYKASAGKVELKKATPHQLREVRRTVLENRKKDQRNFILAFFVALVIISFIVKFGYDLLSQGSIYPYPSYSKSDMFNNSLEKKESDYLYFINDGDRYIRDKHWHNAIFQYSEALKLFPKEFDVNYRLSLAYIYSCSYEGKNCEAASYTLEKLADEFPNKTEIIELKNILNGRKSLSN